MRKLVSAAMACIVCAALLTAAGCSLHQTKTLVLPPTTSKTTVIIRRQALDWNVAHSFYAANDVQLTFQLCPGQHLIERPQVQQNAQNVSITLWANPKNCASPVTTSITIPLGRPLAHRALTNPSLLQ